MTSRPVTSRREILAGLAGVGVVPPVALGRAAGDPRFPYDYLFVEVVRRDGAAGGPDPFLAHLRTHGAAAVAAVGGELLGCFTPLIGWSSEQLAVLVRWPDAAPGRERAVAALTRHPSVRTAERTRLAATLRPGPTDRPRAAGIHTHRWFEVRTGDVDAFVELSGRAWPEFERDFDADIFGLFRAAQDADEARRGVTRMLLNTRYASHAVWEASRTPSPQAADAFRRRRDLTLTTRVASLSFVPIGGP